VPILRNRAEGEFNRNIDLPYDLRVEDFSLAMQDDYDLFFDVNDLLLSKGLGRLEDILERRKATLSGLISDLLTASLARHSRALTENRWSNGHPDLILRGRYPNDAVKSGEAGVEIKSTIKRGGAVDMHGARDQLLCVFVFDIDSVTEPKTERRPLNFTNVFLAEVRKEEFRRNPRGELGTRTATLHREGIKNLRQHWLYRSKIRSDAE
jgi:hypothetical protein